MLCKQLAQVAGLEDSDERALHIQQAMELNHQMMGGLQNYGKLLMIMTVINTRWMHC